jgi:transposase
MIALASGLRVYLACGVTDMRKGMTGLAMLVQQSLSADPFDGAVFAFRGRRAGLIKLIWHDGIGLCMLTKRLEQGSSSGRLPRRAAGLRCRHPSWRPCSTAASGAHRCRCDGRSWRAKSRRSPVILAENAGCDAAASVIISMCRSISPPCPTTPPRCS